MFFFDISICKRLYRYHHFVVIGDRHLKVSIALPVIVIGSITFLLSFLGVFVGNRSGRFFEGKIEIVGGFILIGIGIKILIEHLFY